MRKSGFLKTVVVNIRDYDPTLPGFVVIDRTTKWGNPFPMGNLRDGDTRRDVVAKYREWIQTQPELLEAIPRELKGKVLVCWCAPLPCHGQVLAELADALVDSSSPDGLQ